jgi:methylenetetrahydrofolate reductase (NADPH)
LTPGSVILVPSGRRLDDDSADGGSVLKLRRYRSAEVLTERQRDAVRELVAFPKFELIPMSTTLESAEALPPESMVTVTASPTKGIEQTVEIAEVLKARGHTLIPHLSARKIRDRAHLRDLIARLDAAGIKRIFAVGGDAKDPGEFKDGLSLLRAIDDEGRPFDEIGIPAYPEGHVRVPPEVLLEALRDKQPHADYMATQLCFDPAAIAAWVKHMRASGISLPMHLGTPGIAELRKLMAIVTRIGLADSARYLRKQRRIAIHLIRGSTYGPDTLLDGLAPTLIDPEADVRMLHLFTFNQVAPTVEWQRRRLAER